MSVELREFLAVGDLEGRLARDGRDEKVEGDVETDGVGVDEGESLGGEGGGEVISVVSGRDVYRRKREGREGGWRREGGEESCTSLLRKPHPDFTHASHTRA